MSMITATTWVPRGFAAPFPSKYVFDEDEYARISKLAKLQLDDAKEDLDDAQSEKKQKSKAKGTSSSADNAKETDDIDDDLKEYDLEHYDDDEEDQEGKGDTMAMFGNTKNLVFHENNDDDPYITMKEQDDDDDEREELQILATDNLVLAGRIEDEVAHLEVYVYEDEADNLYVHHDIMLPAIPLAVEWIDLPVGKSSADKDAKGNFVAIGTMEPDIELWNLDLVDSMYPDAILGQGGEDDATSTEKQKKKKKKKSKKANDDYHVDAVLSLSANRLHRNLLASSSADKTIKLWDLNTTKCAKSYSYHTDKVCSVTWHPVESTVLLSGSYDRTVVAADMRAPEAKAPRWGVESDVETVRWNPHDPNYFYISTENGMVHYHDARVAPADPSGSKPVWILQAHDESIASFDINPIIPGFLVTGSTDKQVKLWNVQASGPSMVVSRDLGVGKVFSTTFAPDKEVGFRLAVAGSKGAVQIWDTSTNAAVRAAFSNKVPEIRGDGKERLVGLEESDTDSDSEEGEDEEDEEGEEGEENKGGEGWESMEE
ncbi:periodic tryptophan protein-like protein [Melanomma pulvis-pyrius CBS 109.77]|uniref:Periodic tryptophan protein-like protein n=1 Tax=Melanomma pulvis-pyrius CBS 109.77 TaxID=1314802 RepID=A0A6A6XTQ1_9PLEO|nr:periodic tryptophan protein-like protein [Melanomma pulvis-pyrius CBS 109.77]